MNNLNSQIVNEELKIVAPEGYEIDKENSTFECIKFKKKETRWRDSERNYITGYWITKNSGIFSANCQNVCTNKNVFATRQQAKSALAMAQISQIIANDKRFGGPITNDEWSAIPATSKYCIHRLDTNRIYIEELNNEFHFLTFHTQEQAVLFLHENEDLVKDYLMIE